MNLQISKYLNEYIQRKFPMYYKAMRENEFMAFVSSIASNSSFKKYELVAVRNGDADKIIDNLVDKYAQTKLTNVWEKCVSEYLSEYIKIKFPMYHKAMKENEFNFFVNSIASNSLFKKYNLVAIRNGEADKIINELVERYAQLKLTNVWANFGALCTHIKEVIVKDPERGNVIVNEKTLKDIVKKIAEGFVKDNVLDASYYMNGAYDRIFLSNFDVYCDSIFNETYNHVKKVIDNSNLEIGYDSLTYENLLENVMLEMLKEHQLDEITGGLYDESITTKFINHSKKMKADVQRHIKSVIDSEIAPLLGIPVDEVVADITKMVCEKGELSASKLLAGDLNKLIESYAARKRTNNNYDVDPTAAKEHIYQIIQKLNSVNMPNEKLHEYKEKIFQILYRKYGFSLKSIEFAEHDDLISNIFCRKMMEYNTVLHKAVSRRVKYRPKKRKTHTALPLLLVTATLVGTLGAASYKSIGKKYNEIKADMTYNSVSSLMDGSKYDRVHTKYSDNFKYNADDIVRSYNEYNKFGEVYAYMGFYEAYKHTAEHALAIMDAMLEELDYNISSGKYQSESEVIDTELNIDTYYFLEFAYDRLVEMGCEEIQQDKYITAIEKYKRASWDNDDENKTTMDYIEKNDKALYNIINEMMEIYHQYSAECYKELSVIYGSGKSNGRGSI